MSKRIRRTLYVVVGLIVALGLWAGTGYTINRGSGNVITVERPAADFDRIALSGSGKLIITQGNVEGVSIEAEDNIVDKLEAVVEDGVLRLRQNTPWWAGNLWPQKDIIFRVAVKNLKEVKVSGSAVVSCVGAIQGNELAVRCSGSARVDLAVKVERLVSTVSGSGTMTFTGTTNDLELRCSGSAHFHTRDLTGSSAQVSITGSGRAEVNVSKTLHASITGSGTVAYLGSPDVQLKSSGSGRAVRLTQ